MKNNRMMKKYDSLDEAIASAQGQANELVKSGRGEYSRLRKYLVQAGDKIVIYRRRPPKHIPVMMVIKPGKLISK